MSIWGRFQLDIFRKVQLRRRAHGRDRLHYVKDVTLGEDRSLVHKGNGPSIMAILRDTVVSVLNRAGWRTIAERLRFYSGNAHAALALLGIPLIENA